MCMKFIMSFLSRLEIKYPFIPKYLLFQSPLDRKEIKPVNLKGDQPWIFTGRTDAEAEAPVFWSSDVNRWLWKSPSCWERLRAGGEEGIRGWDGWMASLMQWTWTWANFGRLWGTERPGMLQSMESQRVRHDCATEWQQQLTYRLSTRISRQLSKDFRLSFFSENYMNHNLWVLHELNTGLLLIS